MAASKSPVLPTHFRPVNVQRSGLRVREKYILIVICAIFCSLMFGAFFFVPDLSSARYLNAGKQALSQLVGVGKGRAVVPIRPPIKDDLDDILNGTVKHFFLFVQIVSTCSRKKCIDICILCMLVCASGLVLYYCTNF